MVSMHGVAALLGFALLLVGVFTSFPTGVQSIGVCYGVMGNDLPSPTDVVQLYKSNGINNMRIYFPDPHVLDALRGSSIGLIMGVANENVADLAANEASAASWVATNVKPYYPAVNIMYIAVGNEIAGAVTERILPAMQNLKAALAAAGLGSIRVSTSVSLHVLTDSFPPSKAVFAQPYMAPVVQFLQSTGAPLLANVYSYYAYKDSQKDVALNYALFMPGTTVKDVGNGLAYTNLFDAMVDALYAALEKAGAPNVRIVVSESGWPSDGGTAASVQNAQTYNQNLIKHVSLGTPKRPGALETFLFSMFNENQKNGDPTEKNYGLFHPDKTPVYPITFQ